MQARRWRLGGLMLAAMLLLAGCEFAGPQSALDPAGPVAQAQKDIFVWTLWLSFPVMLGVGGVLVYSLLRFRAKDAADANAIPSQTHGNTRLEIGMTIVATVIVVLVAVPTVRTIFATEQRVDVTALEPGDVLVRATGYQWWFKFEYPELGITTANELIIPAGRRVVVELDSADVLHSFWVPNLAGKRDMIPNNRNQVWFVADEPGTYYGQCAELCLGAHAYMRFRVIAEDDAGFDAWVDAFQTAARADRAGRPARPARSAAGRPEGLHRLPRDRRVLPERRGRQRRLPQPHQLRPPHHGGRRDRRQHAREPRGLAARPAGAEAHEPDADAVGRRRSERRRRDRGHRRVPAQPRRPATSTGAALAQGGPIHGGQ